MKYKDRKEQRRITERMAALLCPLKQYLDDDTRECVDIALRILQDTEIEGSRNE